MISGLAAMLLLAPGCRVPDRIPLAEVDRDQWQKLCERAVAARNDEGACGAGATSVAQCLAGTEVRWVAFEADPDCIVELWRACHGDQPRGIFANLGQEEEEDSGLPFPPVPPTPEADTGLTCESVGDADACRELAACVEVPPG